MPEPVIATAQLDEELQARREGIPRRCDPSSPWWRPPHRCWSGIPSTSAPDRQRCARHRRARYTRSSRGSRRLARDVSALMRSQAAPVRRRNRRRVVDAAPSRPEAGAADLFRIGGVLVTHVEVRPMGRETSAKSAQTSAFAGLGRNCSKPARSFWIGGFAQDSAQCNLFQLFNVAFPATR
jgi:hypothetical protein